MPIWPSYCMFLKSILVIYLSNQSCKLFGNRKYKINQYGICFQHESVILQSNFVFNQFFALCAE